LDRVGLGVKERHLGPRDREIGERTGVGAVSRPVDVVEVVFPVELSRDHVAEFHLEGLDGRSLGVKYRQGDGKGLALDPALRRKFLEDCEVGFEDLGIRGAGPEGTASAVTDGRQVVEQRAVIVGEDIGQAYRVGYDNGIGSGPGRIDYVVQEPPQVLPFVYHQRGSGAGNAYPGVVDKGILADKGQARVQGVGEDGIGNDSLDQVDGDLILEGFPYDPVPVSEQDLVDGYVLDRNLIVVLGVIVVQVPARVG